MKKTLRFFLFTVLLFSLTGCFELIEDTSFNADGSGSYKLTLNLSASTTKINSLIAMDSIDGRAVPSRLELKNKLNHYSQLMESKKGISGVTADLNTETWILHFNLDFHSLIDLRKGIIAVSEEIQQKEADPLINKTLLSYSKNKYQRKIGGFIPQDWLVKIREHKNYEDLKDG